MLFQVQHVRQLKVDSSVLGECFTRVFVNVNLLNDDSCGYKVLIL